MAKKERRKRARSGGTAKRVRAAGRRAQRARNARSIAKASPARLIVPPKVIDPRLVQVMRIYDEAIRHFNHQNFRRAKETLEKVLTGPSRELAERARVHLAICEQRLQRAPAVHLRGADDHYHFAVSQINLANYEEARAHLEKARKLAPKADYVYYALASVAALTREPEEACKHLAQAIKLRPENRYHARNDSDFKPLEDDVRFQALLYPERAGSARFSELRT